MQAHSLRTLHPAPSREDLVSPEQQLQWITGQLRELRAANAALVGQVEQLAAAQSALVSQVAQLSAAQSALTAQLQQLKADNRTLQVSGTATAASIRKPAASPAPAPVRRPAAAATPIQSVKLPMLAPFSGGRLAFGNEWLQRDQVLSITFLDKLSNAPADAWDVSLQQDRSALAWFQPAGRLWLRRPLYHLYIGGKGGVTANPDASLLFCNYCNVEAIHFDHFFDTSKVTRMTRMFANCSRLDNLDLSNFDLSSVTDMTNMFFGCSSLSPQVRDTLRAQGFPA